MGKRLERLLERTVGALLPDGMRSDSDQSRRARVLIIASLALVPLILARALGLATSGHGAHALLLCAVAAMALAGLVVLKRTGSVPLAGHALVLALFVAGSRFAWVRGGVGSPPLIALGALPLVAAFLCGVRAGIGWTLIVLCAVMSFAALPSQGVLLVDAAGADRSFVELSGALLFPVGILALALAYEWSRRSALRAQTDADLERARAEQESQILRADRMAAMGQLAAGVAHEANTPLAYVSANLAFAQERLSELEASNLEALKAEIVEALSEARQGTDRIARVVRDLRTHTRTGCDEPVRAVAVVEILESALKMARTELRHRARVVRSYAETPLVLADETRLLQVFLNLLLNAAQALPEGRASEHRVEVRVDATAEGAVRVEIADTGAGIAPEHLARVTEPFFTTKPSGIGTGLGLAVVSSIVSSLQGELEIESAMGAGTCVRVVLPAATSDSSPAQRAAAVSIAPTTGLRVLAIDDDPLSLRALRRMLREHELVTSESGHAALARIEAGEHFDAIVCDVMMPDLTGIDVHDRIAQFAPEVAKRIVFLTGGVFMGPTADRLAQLPNLKLDKPVDAGALRAAIERIAAEQSSGQRTRVEPRKLASLT